MTLNPEKVTVLAGGMEYSEWESVTINYSMKDATRGFSLVCTERPGAFVFPPGTPLQILANGTLVLDGYVNRYQPQGDDRSHIITVAGRSKSQDFVDSSATNEPGYFENKDPGEIGQELDKFGVGVTAKVPLEKVPYVQIAQGETAFNVLERILRPQGAVQRGLADGSIEITNAEVAMTHAGALVDGWNIKQFSGSLTDDKRHSDYMVKGQGRLGHGDEFLRPFGTAVDGFVGRFRPRIIINEGDTDGKRAQSRADNEKSRAAGISVAATITTQGWRDEGGLLWEPNFKIMVMSPRYLKLVQPMLIESVTLTQNDGQGSLATLKLVDPAAYGGDSGGGSDSDASWG